MNAGQCSTTPMIWAGGGTRHGAKEQVLEEWSRTHKCSTLHIRGPVCVVQRPHHERPLREQSNLEKFLKRRLREHPDGATIAERAWQERLCRQTSQQIEQACRENCKAKDNASSGRRGFNESALAHLAAGGSCRQEPGPTAAKLRRPLLPHRRPDPPLSSASSLSSQPSHPSRPGRSRRRAPPLRCRRERFAAGRWLRRSRI